VPKLGINVELDRLIFQILHEPLLAAGLLAEDVGAHVEEHVARQLDREGLLVAAEADRQRVDVRVDRPLEAGCQPVAVRHARPEQGNPRGDVVHRGARKPVPAMNHILAQK